MPGIRKDHYEVLEAIDGPMPAGAVAILAGLFVSLVCYLLSYFGLPALFDDPAHYPSCAGLLDAPPLHLPPWYCHYIHWGWIIPSLLLVAAVCLPKIYPRRIRLVKKTRDFWKWQCFR